MRAIPPRRVERLTFYTHTLCPYAARVALTLREKSAAFHQVHVDLARKPASFLKLCPRGLVPALDVDGEVHVESIDICRWIDENLEGKPLMPPEGTSARSNAEALIASSSSIVSRGLSCVAGTSGRSWGIGSQGPSSRQLDDFRESLAILERSLVDKGNGGPYLSGEDVSLADLVLYPFLSRFDVALDSIGAVTVTELNAAVAQWMAAMGTRPSCVWADADRSLLTEAYRKHECLDFFDYVTYGEWDLHPHNRSRVRPKS